MSQLKTAVVGTGHLGQHHARIYGELEGVELVGVVDTDEKQGKKIARKYRTQWHASYEDLLPELDLASIAVPTRFHYAIAKDFIQSGVPVLIEKPMTASLDEAKHLVQLAEENHVQVQVGHIERFNPVIEAVQKIAGRPGYIEADRISPFSFRSTDIGVVLDLMIHDIDIVLHLTQSPVESVEAVGVNVLAGSEDVANARLLFENGCVANLTASRVSLKSERKIRVFQEDTYISLDTQVRKARIYRKSDRVKSGEIDLSKIDPKSLKNPLTFVFGDLIKLEEIQMGDEEPLAKEIQSFVEAVSQGLSPRVTAREGLQAIAVAHRILEAIAASTQRIEADEK